MFVSVFCGVLFGVFLAVMLVVARVKAVVRARAECKPGEKGSVCVLVVAGSGELGELR